MKKVTILLSVFALVMGLSQCRKPSFSALNGGETQHVVLSANNGNDGSKVSVSLGKTMDLKWEKGDVITVSGGLNGTLTLVSGDGTPTATFEGYATRGTGDVVFTYGGDPVFTGQTGTQEFVKEKICLEGKDVYKADGNYDVLMKVPYAVLKLDLSKFADTKTDEGVTVTIEGGAEEVTVIGVTAGSKELYVAMPADVSEKTYTFSGNGKVATVKNWPLKTNTFYTGNSETGVAIVIVPEAPVNPELLPGKFSVSADKYVQFSRGNLYCTDKGSNNYEFSFEQNQYDYRCRSGKTNDKAVINGAETTTPSSTSGLFEWIRRASSSAANDWGAFSKHNNPLSDNTTSDGLDFGEVFPASDWTTLTGTEWQYLLEHHTKEIVTVNNVVGLCIAPDAYIGDIADSYTVEQWSVAEGNGMVFLPFYGFYDPNGAGALNEKIVIEETAYWSSTSHDFEKNYAQALKLRKNISISVSVEGRWRHYAQYVRLVKKSPKPAPEVEFIDLGLPSGTLWANANLGAKTLEDPGYYFFWGDPRGYVYNGSKWVEADGVGEVSFNSVDFQNSVGYSVYNNTQPWNPAVNDAAAVSLGNGATLPTHDDIAELTSNTFWVASPSEKCVYFFAPDESHHGGGYAYGFGTLDKEDALLVLPYSNVASGNGYGGSPTYAFILEGPDAKYKYVGYSGADEKSYSDALGNGMPVRAVKVVSD